MAVSAQRDADSAGRPVQDTTVLQHDSLAITRDTVKTYVPVIIERKPSTGTGWKFDTLHPTTQEIGGEVLRRFASSSSPAPAGATDGREAGELRHFSGKEILFYALIVLLLLFAFLKQLFPKYFNDLFRVFFRTTLKQRQIREQLMQTPLPSLLLNGFFVLSGAFYAAFLVEHFGLNPLNNFWLLVLYCGLGISVAYFVKFIGLKISGWLFNVQDAANSYIFIVFIINKMIGILLLPVLLLLAFSVGNIYYVGLTLSWCIIGGLILYRFILTYAAIRNQVKVNPFHFFLYLCAFEIAPLLLVYKALLLYFGQSA